MTKIKTVTARAAIGMLAVAAGLTMAIATGSSASAQPASESVQRGPTVQTECIGPYIENSWWEGPRAMAACTGIVYRIKATYCNVTCVTETGPWRANWEWSTLVFPPGGSIVSAEIQPL